MSEAPCAPKPTPRLEQRHLLKTSFWELEGVVGVREGDWRGGRKDAGRSGGTGVVCSPARSTEKARAAGTRAMAAAQVTSQGCDGLCGEGRVAGLGSPPPENQATAPCPGHSPDLGDCTWKQVKGLMPVPVRPGLLQFPWSRCSESLHLAGASGPQALGDLIPPEGGPSLTCGGDGGLGSAPRGFQNQEVQMRAVLGPSCL